MNHGGGCLLQGKPILYGTVSGSIGEGRGKVKWEGNRMFLLMGSLLKCIKLCESHPS